VTWLIDEMGFEIGDGGDWFSAELERETGRPLRVPATAFEGAETAGEFQREVARIVEDAGGGA
jgi:hypothetical protein